jgi:hypothetical protein
MTQKHFEYLLAKARKTNADRDRMEHKAGFATPTEGPLDGQLRTVIIALVAGLQSEDIAASFEALAMLIDIENNLRPGEDAFQPFAK